jgi:hypothetical protein
MPFQYFLNPKHTFLVHRFEEGKIKKRKSVNDYVGGVNTETIKKHGCMCTNDGLKPIF